jgi:hypothetical protein
MEASDYHADDEAEEEMEDISEELYYADNEDSDGDDPEPQEYYIFVSNRLRPVLLIDLTGENRAPANVAKSY